jgi:hypothetical protein
VFIGFTNINLAANQSIDSWVTLRNIGTNNVSFYMGTGIGWGAQSVALGFGQGSPTATLTNGYFCKITLGITPGLCVGSADFGSLAGVGPFNTSTNTIIFVPEDENTSLLHDKSLARVRALGSKVYVFDGQPSEVGWHSTDGLHYVTNNAQMVPTYGLLDIGTDGSNNFVAVGSTAIWSSAGSDSNWVARFPYTNGAGFNAVICQGGRWIAGGFSRTGGGLVATSTDMTNWTYTALAQEIRDLATSGTNTAAAAGGIIYTSPDGVTWTGTTTHFLTNSAIAMAMTWDGSVFISVGYHGTNAWQAVGNTTSWTDQEYGQIVNGVVTQPQANGLATGHDSVNGYTKACAAYQDNYYGGFASYQSTPDVTRSLLWAMPPIYQTKRATTNACVSVAYFNGNFIVATRPIGL